CEGHRIRSCENRDAPSRDFQKSKKVEEIVLSILHPNDQLLLGQSLNDARGNEEMSPFWDVIHDERQPAFPSNCLEMVEESVFASRKIVWGSRNNRICPSVLGILGKGQDIPE